MERSGVVGRVERDGADAEFASRTRDPDRDLATIGDQ
jgi:hypothetical protein